MSRCGLASYLDLSVDGALLVVELIVVVRVHLQVVESKLLLDALLERLTLLEGHCVSLGNDGNNIDNIGQLLQHDDIDRLEGVAGWLDKEQAAVNASVLNVALTLGGELLSKVRRVLVLDVLDDRVPAAVVVDQVTVARGVDNVEPETNAILLDDVRHRVDLGSGSDNLVRKKTTLGLDEVRSEDGVDKGGLSETSLACDQGNTRHVSRTVC